MKLIASKSRLKGIVCIPGSKSHTIRAVTVGSLATGESIIRRPLVSSDTLSAVDCYRALGAEIDTSDKQLWRVKGTGGKVKLPSHTIDVGNSGTTLRLAMGSAALAASSEKVVFTGDEQIQSRPLAPLIKALGELGAKCKSIKDNGKAPVEICGGLVGGKISIACPTSQYLSSLLLCTPLAPADSEIDVTLLNEPGYVQMTVDWLDRQNIKYENRGLTWFRMKGGQRYSGFDYTIPADFSSATFFLCAAALFGDNVKIVGLDFSDSQPDKAVVDYLKAMGANITIEGGSVTVRSGQLAGIEIDMNATPDALPAMAVTAAYAKGRTRLFNVAQARTKETDRIKCMAEELGKVGVATDEFADGLSIIPARLNGGEVSGRGDHRIVMAMAMAGLGSDEKIIVDTAEAMSVTFPDFVELMQSLGADMKVVD